MKILFYTLFFPFIILYLLTKKLLEIIKQNNIKQMEGRNFRIYIAGAQYENEDGTDRQTYIKKCGVGEELLLVKSPSKYDETGIKIYRTNGECIGWVPAKYSYEFTSDMERGISIKAFFHSKIKPNNNYNYYGGKVTIIKN